MRKNSAHSLCIIFFTDYLSDIGGAQLCMWECEMIPERPADRASDLIMMNQGWEKLSGHQPFSKWFYTPQQQHEQSQQSSKTQQRCSELHTGTRYIA